MKIELTIPGRPVPAQRMTRKTKWTKRARRSLEYQESVACGAMSQELADSLMKSRAEGKTMLYKPQSSSKSKAHKKNAHKGRLTCDHNQPIPDF